MRRVQNFDLVTMRPSSALIIGGGFAGVAAAARLHDAGVRVTILESRARLGGRARSDALDGWTLDIGAQLIGESYRNTVALLARGRAHPFRVMPGRDVYIRDGRRYPITFGSTRSMLAFGALSAGEKMRLGLHLLPTLARHRDALRADARRIPAELDDQSAGAFVTSAIGRDAADALVEPVCNALLGARGDEVSLAFYLTLGRYGSDGHLLAPAGTGGWSALLDATCARMTVVREAAVVSLACSANGVEARARDGASWRADCAVVATDAHAAAGLLDGCAGIPEGLTGWLRGVAYRPTVTVALTTTRPLPHDALGILPHNGSGLPAAALAVHGAKASRDDGQAGDAVLAWPTPDAAAALLREPAEAIARAMAPAVEALLPNAAGQIARARVYRHDPGTPIPFPGFFARAAVGRTLAAAITAPLALAGDYLTMPMIEGAVVAGETAAAQVMGAR